MQPEREAFRQGSDEIETDDKLTQLLFGQEEAPSLLDYSQWHQGSFGAKTFEIEGITVWYEPLVLAISSEVWDQQAVRGNLNELVRVALGIPVEGIILTYLDSGGETKVYSFLLGESKMAVGYIQYADVLSGIDKLEAMVLLRNMGCTVNRPIFATNRSLISELVIPRRGLASNEVSKHKVMMETQIDKLLKASSELKQKDLWKPWWRIDWSNRHNFIPIFDDSDRLISVCCVDPVAVDVKAWLEKYR